MYRLKTRPVLLILVIAHWLSCAAFLALRPPSPPGSTLDVIDATAGDGNMIRRRSTSEELGFIAERPLYQWSEWHGGESVWVKALLALNLLPALASGTLGHPSKESSMPARTQTWITAGIFFVLSTAQWAIVGFLLDRRRSRAP